MLFSADLSLPAQSADWTPSWLPNLLSLATSPTTPYLPRFKALDPAAQVRQLPIDVLALVRYPDPDSDLNPEDGGKFSELPKRNPSGKAQIWVVSDTGIGSPLWQTLGDLGILTPP